MAYMRENGRRRYWSSMREAVTRITPGVGSGMLARGALGVDWLLRAPAGGTRTGADSRPRVMSAASMGVRRCRSAELGMAFCGLAA